MKSLKMKVKYNIDKDANKSNKTNKMKACIYEIFSIQWYKGQTLTIIVLVRRKRGYIVLLMKKFNSVVASQKLN